MALLKKRGRNVSGPGLISNVRYFETLIGVYEGTQLIP